VNCTDPVRLENTVEADHNLTKAKTDTTESRLTAQNGWAG
jgi:hypothetical protein